MVNRGWSEHAGMVNGSSMVVVNAVINHRPRICVNGTLRNISDMVNLTKSKNSVNGKMPHPAL